ncbi:MAG TPA: ECF-type sigma factor [Arenimonas sp.]|nr:ECF-type sigma factor [Arenimonas sp.]
MADREGPGEDSPDTVAICAGADELAPLLYPDLKRAAHGVRARVGANSTLHTTALINEAYLKLARGGQWKSRHHFLAAAAVAMRHVLVDQARGRMRLRRGEGATHLPLDEARNQASSLDGNGWSAPDDVCIALGDALQSLARVEPRLARVVECRYFAGYTDDETASILGLTTRTVRRDWVKARSWLRDALAGDGSATD